MDYRIVTCEGEDVEGVREMLQAGVRAWVKDGWRPQGGASFEVSTYYTREPYGRSSLERLVVAAQAMVKDEPAEGSD